MSAERPRACLCGRVNCERHRRKAWRGGHRYQGEYGAAYQELRRRLVATITPETRCALCGRPRIEGDGWQVDHIVPTSRGGASTLDNLQIVHASCNRRRGSRLGAERSAERRRAKGVGGSDLENPAREGQSANLRPISSDEGGSIRQGADPSGSIQEDDE